ncbi:enoyl-CoA hydratase/isomerase [Nitzschia inconspicua]|uniref:Enoyl-CoA hydratase/isomerase n=1 Tax=Nitzschia inconspicua TaxID=303405 RepID=A0A9K3L737_9STRA|nr:enoyl-CoA hydratase/isomerase [Nitzschia inconspicua]
MATIVLKNRGIWKGIRSTYWAQSIPRFYGTSMIVFPRKGSVPSGYTPPINLAHPHQSLRMSPLTHMASSDPQILMETIPLHSHKNETNHEKSGPCIAKLTLNRPKANAMGKEFIQSLQEWLNCLEEKESNYDLKSIPRSVVITSWSPKVFSAGADLKERALMTQEEAADFVTLLRSTMERVARLPMPVICAIEGVAVGGGLELALAADLRIAGANAILGLPETSLAIIPGAGGTQRLPRLVGAARAKELIWTAKKLNAQEALEVGLVEQVVPAGDATATAVEMGLRIANNGPIAVKASKESIDRGLECRNIYDALEVERQCYAKVLPTQDRLEGLAAFKEGRNPRYNGI